MSRLLMISVLSFLLIACADAIEEDSVRCVPEDSVRCVPEDSVRCVPGDIVKANIIDDSPKNEVAEIEFSADLSSLGKEVEIRDLDGTCLLKNKSIQVTTDTFFPNEIVKTFEDLKRNPYHPYFQQLNAYYYANKLLNRVRSLGGNLSEIRGLSIDAHCNDCENAYYSLALNTICLGWAEKPEGKGRERGFCPSRGSIEPVSRSIDSTIWSADDADVIVHEFGHAINHNLASVSVFNSNTEAGALDEALSDYWAMSLNDDPLVSAWFLGLISRYERSGEGSHSYPSDMTGQIHRDGRVFMQALWQVRNQFGQEIADQLVIRMTQLLPSLTRYKEAVDQMLLSINNIPGVEATAKADLEGVLRAKGLLRSDSAQGLILSDKDTRKKYYVIDDYYAPFTAKGNCNGELDSGETALVLANLRYKGRPIGMGKAVLIIPDTVSGITAPTGGSVGYYLRLGGRDSNNKWLDFVDVAKSSNVLIASSVSDLVIAQASFLVTAESKGTKELQVKFTPMGGTTVTIPLTLEVGARATKRNCGDAGLRRKEVLWEPWNQSS